MRSHITTTLTRAGSRRWPWALLLTLAAHGTALAALGVWRFAHVEPLPRWDALALPARAVLSLPASTPTPAAETEAEVPIKTVVPVTPPAVAVTEPVVAALALTATEPTPPAEVTALLAEPVLPEPPPTEPTAQPPTPTSPSVEPVPANVSEPDGRPDPANNAPLASAPSDVDPAQRDAVLTQVPPSYPDRARRRGQQGTVRLRIALTPAGVPSAVTVLESCGFHLLDEAALTAAWQWRFAAANEPERVTTISIQFKLQ